MIFARVGLWSLQEWRDCLCKSGMMVVARVGDGRFKSGVMVYARV